MRILVICTGNAARSQMAEAFLRSFAGNHPGVTLEVFSAGSWPAAEIHPAAVAVMRERGIDLVTGGYFPKPVDIFTTQPFDIVVTVCDKARNACPTFTGPVGKRLHLAFADPAAATGSREEILGVFRRTRDEIEDAFGEFFRKEVLHIPETQRERMIKLAEEFFATKNDPEQLTIDEEVLARLRSIHPSAVTEESDEGGPVAWLLLVPTTAAVMEKFLAKEIGEQELLELTPAGASYDAVYLCSVLVLPERREKGLATRLTAKALRSIMADHPVRTLFVWEFSGEGRRLARAVADELSLPLRSRKG